MPLAEYLADGANSHSREEILTCRFLFDVKLAAATRGYHLLSHYSDVDHNGFDIILDDLLHVIRLQLKSVLHNAANPNPNWNDIQRFVLRPNVHSWETMGYVVGASPGAEGGVVLIELTFDNNNNLVISYFFSDVYMVTAVAEDIVQRHGNTRNAAMNVLIQLEVGASNDVVTLTKQMFVPAATPAHCLALMNFPSTVNPTNWRGLIKVYANHVWGDASLPMMGFANADDMKPSILQMLRDASGHADP
jgi:hypothetical protein